MRMGVCHINHRHDRYMNSLTYASIELEKSTQLFGILADPNGSNNAIAQVLYGLALR